MKALSVRPPWAWLIVNGYKDIENRTWRTNYRGRVLIHASGTVSKEDYAEAARLAEMLGIALPAPADLPVGGITGAVTITDCVQESESPWFTGPHGFVLADATPLPFTGMRGQLRFFETGTEEYVLRGIRDC